MSQPPTAIGRDPAKRGGAPPLRGPLAREGLWLALGLALIAAVALVHRVPGLGPSSLFLDDQWVAVLVRDASVGRIVELAPPAPLGFLLALKGVTSLAGFSAAALQALPLACGVLAIPLLGWVAYRWTRRLDLGLVAALLLALDPVLGVYALRVKPFAGDALITAALLALAVEALRSPSRRWFVALAVAAVVSPLFSLPSLIVGAVLVNGLAAWRWREERKSGRPTWPGLAIVSGYDAVAIGLALLLLAGQRNPALVRYWSEHFLPLDDPARLGDFARGAGANFFRSPFPAELPWLPLILIPGAVWLVARREYRPLGAAMGAVIAAVFAASALRLYPVGQERLDLFAHPILILIATAALTPPTVRVRALPVIGAAVLAVVLVLGGSYGYPPVGDREMVSRAVSALGDDDALVVYPWANYAAGLYGPWPTEIVEVNDSTNRFYVHPRRPHTLVLHESLGGVDFQQDARVMVEQLRPFLDRGYRRVVYISGTTMPRPHEWTCRYIVSRGYRVAQMEERDGATFIVFQR